MKLSKLIGDAAGAGDDWSIRAKAQALAPLLAAEGWDITYRAIEQWVLRDSIPAKWLYPIQRVAAARGRSIDLNLYAGVDDRKRRGGFAGFSPEEYAAASEASQRVRKARSERGLYKGRPRKQVS